VHSYLPSLSLPNLSNLSNLSNLPTTNIHADPSVLSQSRRYLPTYLPTVAPRQLHTGLAER